MWENMDMDDQVVTLTLILNPTLNMETDDPRCDPKS